MAIRIIKPGLHGILDYAAALGLIVVVALSSRSQRVRSNPAVPAGVAHE